MANRWYVALDGDELGPMSDTGLERMIQGGRIERDTLVRNGAESEWLPARDAEEILAARPARQRPGEAAIRAAIQSKQAVSRPPAPPAARLPSKPAKDPSDVLPPPDDLPAPVAPEGASAAPESAALPAPDAEAAPAPPRPSFSRSSLAKVAAGAGYALIFAASFAVAWMTARQFSSGGAAAQTNASLAPMAGAQLAALEEEARRLASEVAEAKQKLEQAQQAAAPADQPPPAKSADLENPAARGPQASP
jgi:hypothetical protein